MMHTSHDPSGSIICFCGDGNRRNCSRGIKKNLLHGENHRDDPIAVILFVHIKDDHPPTSALTFEPVKFSIEKRALASIV